MNGTALIPAEPAHYEVYMIRGEQVVLDAAVAAGFGVETKRVNEAVARNPAKFTEAHVFTLSEDEAAALRSQTATSKQGRGGTRYAPHVYTAKGVARLATVLDSDEALRATDLIIDTFLQVQRQVAMGTSDIAIEHPSRLRPDDEDGFAVGIRAKLASAVSTLLDTVIDANNDKTVRQTALGLGSDALENLRERLRTKGLENAKIEADVMLVMAQAEKVYAETRKGHAEAEGIELDNIPKRITAVKQLMALYRESEPAQLVRLLTDMGQARAIPIQQKLPAPTNETDEGNR